jgi:hypothetical protein
VFSQTLSVNGEPLTVIGVAPEGFSGTTLGLRPEVFVPITMRWRMEPTRFRDEARRAPAGSISVTIRLPEHALGFRRGTLLTQLAQYPP